MLIINPELVGERLLLHIENINTLQLFVSPNTDEHMTWHHSHDTMDKVMVHLFCGEAWKYFNRMHPQFLVE
jgi:hypothetical protein